MRESRPYVLSSCFLSSTVTAGNRYSNDNRYYLMSFQFLTTKNTVSTLYLWRREKISSVLFHAGLLHIIPNFVWYGMSIAGVKYALQA
jgi:hypothetical protein